MSEQMVIAWSQVGDCRLAIESAHVQAVAADLDAGDDRIDAAARFGLASGEGPRRALLLSVGRRAVWLVLGPALTIRTVLRATRTELPPLVAPGLRALGVGALISEEAGFTYLLDPFLLEEGRR